MKIKFANALILPLQNDFETFKGDIVVDDENIIYVGEKYDGEADKTLDMTDMLLMPAFKNAHAHGPMTFLRSYADDLPLAKWLNERVFPKEDMLSDEDIKAFFKVAVLEYLESGISASFDMYKKDTELRQSVSEKMGYRSIFCSSTADFGPYVEQDEKDYLKYNYEGSFTGFRFGFHAEYTTSKDLLLKIKECADKYKAPVYAHCCETLNEVNSCIERNGMPPVEYLESLGMFENGGGLFHCVHLTDEAIEIIKKRKLFVITNPASNLKLASGIAPIKRLLDEGVCVAIGTDGPASNNCLDMFREMFLVTALQKYKEEDASVVSAEQVLTMACKNGAYAMGLEDCDCLAAGKKADIIALDLNRPNMRPSNNIVKNIVYSGSKVNVYMTMVNGRILYLDNKFYVGEDIREIYDTAEKLMIRYKED